MAKFSTRMKRIRKNSLIPFIILGAIYGFISIISLIRYEFSQSIIIKIMTIPVRLSAAILGQFNIFQIFGFSSVLIVAILSIIIGGLIGLIIGMIFLSLIKR